MADRKALILSIMLSVLILLTAAAGIVMLAAPQAVREQLGLVAAQRVELSGEEALLAEDLLPPGALTVDAVRRAEQLRQWQQMEPAGRRQMQQRYAALRWLSPTARQMLVERYEELGNLDPQQREVMRQQAETLADFEGTLGRQDIATLNGLPAAERARALLVLWREAQGLQ